MTYAGYILGFPNDTPNSILHDIEVIKRELPIDVLEFFYLTPLPGSEDHQKLFAPASPMDADLNKYDLIHRCTAHPRMTPQDWDCAYMMAGSAIIRMRISRRCCGAPRPFRRGAFAST